MKMLHKVQEGNEFYLIKVEEILLGENKSAERTFKAGQVVEMPRWKNRNRVVRDKKVPVWYLPYRDIPEDLRRECFVCETLSNGWYKLLDKKTCNSSSAALREDALDDTVIAVLPETWYQQVYVFDNHEVAFLNGRLYERVKDKNNKYVPAKVVVVKDGVLYQAKDNKVGGTDSPDNLQELNIEDYMGDDYFVSIYGYGLQGPLNTIWK